MGKSGNILLVLLLAGIAKGISAQFVRNFKITAQNTTHVSFSWDIQSGYHDTSNINYFRIYYRYAYPGYSSYGYTTSYYVSTSDTTQINGGLTFLFATSVTNFNNLAQYIMWLYVNHDISPNNLYSEQIYAELGATTAVEIAIKLWDGQTCQDFTSTSSAGTVGNEVYRALRIYCQCTYEFINAIRIRTGYFDCSPTGYVTYRAYMTSSDATKHPSTLVGALNNWLQDTNNNTIIAGGRKYTVELGACGVTVPYTNAPFCTTAKVPEVTTPIPNAQSSTAESIRATSADNTAVIVASVFAAMFFVVTLALVGYILVIKGPSRKMSTPVAGVVANRPSTRAASQLQPTVNVQANRQTNKESIELEPYEPIYDHMN